MRTRLKIVFNLIANIPLLKPYLLGRILNSNECSLNELKIAKFCQTSSNSWSISRYYLHYFPRLTAIYLIFITIFKMRTRPNTLFHQSIVNPL